MAEVEPREDPGAPPEGVRVETAGGTTRVIFETGPPGQWRNALWWIGPPLLFGAIAYRLDPKIGYLAAGMTLLILLTIASVSRRRRGGAAVSEPAICLNADRIWIERPPPAGPIGVRTDGAALSGAGAPGAPGESLPLDSIPRRAVQLVRVEETRPAPRSSGAKKVRLLIEASAGRLEYAVPPSHRQQVEWAERYLRKQLAEDE